jgi:glyoxylase-like metal-dependent hydrolase (beta-lactamase superfamily II)
MLESVAPGVSGVFLLRGWSDLTTISSNAYFLVSPGKDALVIDCGNASAQTSRALKAAVKELGCRVAGVYCTHGHFDHAGGVNAFSVSVPVFLDERDFFLLPENERGRFTPLAGRTIDFDGLALEILRTPGHSPGSVCFWDAQRKILFSGDTLFAGGAFGRTDFPGGNYAELRSSLASLERLGWRVLCPGHDEVERR